MEPQPNTDRSLYVDRRFRALPFGREPAAPALSRPSGRHAGDNPVRAAGRLHAWAAAGDRRSTCRAADWRFRSRRARPSASSAKATGTALIMPRTWKSALAPFLAGIPERRLCRRGAIFPAQRRALRRARCRAWSTAAPCWRCPAAPSCRHNGRCRNSRLRPPKPPRGATGAAWLADGRPVVALAPGAVGPSKRWPSAS